MNHTIKDYIFKNINNYIKYFTETIFIKIIITISINNFNNII